MKSIEVLISKATLEQAYATQLQYFIGNNESPLHPNLIRYWKDYDFDYNDFDPNTWSNKAAEGVAWAFRLLVWALFYILQFALYPFVAIFCVLHYVFYTPIIWLRIKRQTKRDGDDRLVKLWTFKR